ncbi:response regulator [Phaeovulum sp.]|uniref:response regulator n=1 Tax=Phaeovulum sp. TaxID=2934796 RepID=UPI0039E6F322
MNILAVDDDELQLTVLSATLGSLGFPPARIATSAAIALEEIKESMVPFDLFLLDIKMPNTDGIELCKQIRSMPGYEDAAVIMITALTERSHMDRAFEAGAVDYVTKPFDKIELLTRINVARQVASAKHEADRRKKAFSALQRQVYEIAGSTSGAPATIFGVPNVIDYMVLSNFMLQIPFSRTFSATSFAVKIREFEKLHLSLELEPGAIYEVLTLVAKALSRQLIGRGFFVAYAGSGVFVCAAQWTCDLPLEEIADEVQSQIFEIEMVGGSDRRQAISVEFGRRQTNGVFTLDRRVGLLLRAISDMENTTSGSNVTHGRPNGRRRAGTFLSVLQRLLGFGHA